MSFLWRTPARSNRQSPVQPQKQQQIWVGAPHPPPRALQSANQLRLPAALPFFLHQPCISHQSIPPIPPSPFPPTGQPVICCRLAVCLQVNSTIRSGQRCSANSPPLVSPCRFAPPLQLAHSGPHLLPLLQVDSTQLAQPLRLPDSRDSICTDKIACVRRRHPVLERGGDPTRVKRVRKGEGGFPTEIP